MKFDVHNVVACSDTVRITKLSLAKYTDTLNTLCRCCANL